MQVSCLSVEMKKNYMRTYNRMLNANLAFYFIFSFSRNARFVVQYGSLPTKIPDTCLYMLECSKQSCSIVFFRKKSNTLLRSHGHSSFDAKVHSKPKTLDMTFIHISFVCFQTAYVGCL